MRIRKHAKISPLVYAASYLKPGTVIQTQGCQLNQSPWDVMTFPSPSNPEMPPPPPLVCPVNVSSTFSHQWKALLQAEDSYMVNGNFADFIAGDQSPSSMKFEVGDDGTQKWDHGGSNIPPAEMFGNNGGTEMEQEFNNDDEGGEIINLCCKSDGKGWQCRRKAKEGHSLCEHHSYSHQVNKTSNSSHSAGKKSEKASESRRRPRAKKPTAASSSNPYEYYYYSGFGPRWGKKRGAAATKRAEPYTSSGGSEASKTDVELAGEPNTPYNNNNNAPAAAETETETEEENFAFSRSSRMDIEGFDYIEDDDDDDDDYEEDDEIGQTEKKRARKPIKARSLKSLM